VATVLEYQDRSVKQGHDDRGTSALQLQSGEAVRLVAPTQAQAAAFSKLQLVICSAGSSIYKNFRHVLLVRWLANIVALRSLRNRTCVDTDILTGNDLRNEIMEVKRVFLNHSVY
jgi:hypothetical protein